MANKKELLAQCKDLGINPQELTPNEKGNITNEIIQEAIDKKLSEADNGTEATETEATDQDEVTVEDIEVLEAELITTNDNELAFEYEDEVYTFSDRFPKSGRLQVDGKVLTKKQLLKTPDALEQLIVGNSPFIKPL